MPYADYDFYKNAFGGTRLTEEEFQPAALRAADGMLMFVAR